MAVSVEQRDRVLVVTIDRPEVRNAYDPPTLRAMADAFGAAKDDPGIGAAVLTATGDRSFCSGFDLNVLGSGADVAESIARFDEVIHDLERIPIVAAVAGDAIGGGFEIMTKCDLAVAADDITVGLPEVTRGLVPGGGGTLLPSRIPMAIALELALVGEPSTVQRAYDLGLVNRVVPRADVLHVAVDLAARIAANAPYAVRDTRRLLWTCFLEGAAAAGMATRTGVGGPERQRERDEGLASFREKRPPRWR
jgi:enoyl-CoA hydratase